MLKLSHIQLRVFLLTFFIAFFDGYDTAAIGYIAPSLLAEWGLAKSALAPILSAALFGLALGAVSFGPVADRFGRKITLIVSVAIFAIGAIVSSYAGSLRELEILRFITGIGLGAAMPNAVTILSEYAPSEKRSFIVNTMFCGFPLGIAIGGFIAAWLIPNYGWQSTLLFGGVLPLILVFLMTFLLPESHDFMRIREQKDIEVRGVRVVLSPEYIAGSILLWITYFMGLVLFYGVINWMPTLFHEINMSQGTASIVTGLFAIGTLGAIGSGWLMDKWNPARLISILCLLACIGVALIGAVVEQNLWVLIVVILISGVFMNTAQSSLPAYAAGFFPTEGRTTGVSWMLGIGRFGGIAGSFLVAQLVDWDFSVSHIFYVLAIPALIQAICLWLKDMLYR
ncbi:permease of the major facilitator superfamily [Taylorella equigenitalis 14/56]|uniref:Permease of the major facilitator superfamily n=1 Tax=Taylorella equigenitalis 14/56 TaxID=1091497 RepID=I7JP54_9BURK|nr:aromatic acid/H+ symport family MFS transporter [Taylorella equigenitalis]CCG17868.1 permease of the major facilitator superfamily [Taylorella equigenitalis 14/56]